MQTIHIASIVLEAVIVLVALMGVFSKKKYYMLGFVLTFAIYVYYDLAQLLQWQAFSALLYPLFCIATVSALLSIIVLYRKY